jgi:hypothetical protein
MTVCYIFTLRRRHLYLSLIVVESVIVKTNTLTPQPASDPRFEITITSPQNEAAQFKTRGGHPVRKVLAAACKTFGIEYERCVVVIFSLCFNLSSTLDLVSSCAFQRWREAKSRQMNLTVQRRKLCPNAE